MVAVSQRFNQLDANALPAVPTRPNDDRGINVSATDGAVTAASGCSRAHQHCSLAYAPRDAFARAPSAPSGAWALAHQKYDLPRWLKSLRRATPAQLKSILWRRPKNTGFRS